MKKDWVLSTSLPHPGNGRPTDVQEMGSQKKLKDICEDVESWKKMVK